MSVKTVTISLGGGAKTLNNTDDVSTKTIIFKGAKSENISRSKIVGQKKKKTKQERIEELYKKYKLLKKEDYNKLSFVKPKEIWVRYYNKTTFDLNRGGFLLKYDKDANMIKLLALPYNNVYCLKLDNIILFVPKVIEISKYKSNIIEKYIENKIKAINETPEAKIKEKLFKLYKENKLLRKD